MFDSVAVVVVFAVEAGQLLPVERFDCICRLFDWVWVLFFLFCDFQRVFLFFFQVQITFCYTWACSGRLDWLLARQQVVAELAECSVLFDEVRVDLPDSSLVFLIVLRMFFFLSSVLAFD